MTGQSIQNTDKYDNLKKDCLWNTNILTILNQVTRLILLCFILRLAVLCKNSKPQFAEQTVANWPAARHSYSAVYKTSLCKWSPALKLPSATIYPLYPTQSIQQASLLTLRITEHASIPLPRDFSTANWTQSNKTALHLMHPLFFYLFLGQQKGRSMNQQRRIVKYISL